MLGDFKRFYRAMRLKAADGNMNAEEPKEAVPIPKTSAEVKTALEKAFNGSFDFKVRSFENDTVLMAYIDNLVDKLLIAQTIVEPMMQAAKEIKSGGPEKKKAVYLKTKLASFCNMSEFTDFNECINSILSGCTVIFVDGDATALNISQQKFEKRAISEPSTETVSRGSREGFTESLPINTTLLRRIIKDGNLVFEIMPIGRVTKTNVSICYLKGLANQEIIDEVRKRLKNIKTDAILESGYLEEYISDSPLSIFPMAFNSERPEAIAGGILDGKVAIICDGTPNVMTVPNLFVDYLQYAEDYNNRWVFSVIIRAVRFFAFFLSTMAPAYYIALLCFHQDVIPFKLLVTLAASRQTVPLSPLIEMLVLTLLFEVIKESGLRISRSIGQAVSIVGGLIVGEAAVQAGIFSAPAVVIIGATSLSAFIISKLDATVIIMRVSLMIAANILGILGIVLLTIGFFIYMCSIKSFGVPYLSPITPLDGQDMKDTFIRIPLWAMFERPETVTRRYGEKDLRNKRND
jgi:spore germination protein KA